MSINKNIEAAAYIVERANLIKSRFDLDTIKREAAKKFKVGMILNSDIFKAYQQKKVKANETFLHILKKRAVRTMSGIAPVAVLTKSYPCPGVCAYCPHEKNVPVSYLSNEPAVMRAIRCHYDPYVQVQLRLKALEANGHAPTKIELIVIGGTWSYLPAKYKYWYILECFRAANDFRIDKIKSRLPASSTLAKLKSALVKEQKRNENTKYQIIGLTLETRPDYINAKEIAEMRSLGCTRVEIGVQAIDDEILKKNQRGHKLEAIITATKLLKDSGFKVTYHIMPALPGSNPKKDLAMFKELFSSQDYQPDQIKFYPTVVTKGSLLYQWWRAGKYKPYSDKVLQNLIVECKKIVPKYVRIIRLIRDIPGESIEAGNKITNLRQIMKDRGVKCNCIRCREVKEQEQNIQANNLSFEIEKYPASLGTEYFLSFNSKDKKLLYGFCRLRLHDDIATIRELHVYGQLVSVGSKKKVQHAGLGKQLMIKAEEIARMNKIKMIRVISGVGVRGYYRKLGYKLKDTYMVKNLS